jgi:putative transposase
LLNGELFFSLAEAQALIEAWRLHFNAVRPHSALSYRPLAPETIVPHRDAVVLWASERLEARARPASNAAMN